MEEKITSPGSRVAGKTAPGGFGSVDGRRTLHGDLHVGAGMTAELLLLTMAMEMEVASPGEVSISRPRAVECMFVDVLYRRTLIITRTRRRRPVSTRRITRGRAILKVICLTLSSPETCSNHTQRSRLPGYSVHNVSSSSTAITTSYRMSHNPRPS